MSEHQRFDGWTKDAIRVYVAGLEEQHEKAVAAKDARIAALEAALAKSEEVLMGLHKGGIVDYGEIHAALAAIREVKK